MMKIQFNTRSFDRNTDLDFVTSTSLKCIRDYYPFISNQTFFKEFKNIFNFVLSNSDIIMAVDIEDPTHLYGFIIYEFYNQHAFLHFAYVKYNYRRLGIARHLLEKALPESLSEDNKIIITIPTTISRDYSKIHKNFQSNPFILFRRYFYYENKINR